MNTTDDSTKSVHTLRPNKNKNNLDSIPCRLEFIKDLMKGQNIDPLIDIETVDDDNSGESFDTRHKLHKKTLDFSKVIEGLGGKLDYIKSGTTGHTFHGIAGDMTNPEYDYAVKVSAFQKKTKYGGIHDIRRPENAEVNMIRVLSQLIINRQTPHIVLPICTFDTNIDNFVNLMDQGYVEKGNKKYGEFIEKYKRGEYYDNVSILISEWANQGDFLDYVRKNYTTFSPLQWKVFFFQIISSLAVIQSKFPSFRHNDLKANNILVHKTNKKNSYSMYRVVRKSYKVPNINYQVKIWDFDFACIPGLVDNQKVNKSWTKAINVTPDSNRYYDLHYFFNTFIKKGFFSQFMTENCIPKDAKDFVMRVVPKKYQSGRFVHERGRILINYEVVTPDELLKNDEYFAEFRVDDNVSQKGGNTGKHIRSKNSDIYMSNQSEPESHIKRLLEGSHDKSNTMKTQIQDIINAREIKKKSTSKGKSKSKSKGNSKSKSNRKSNSKSKSKSNRKSKSKSKSNRKNKDNNDSKKSNKLSTLPEKETDVNVALLDVSE